MIEVRLMREEDVPQVLEFHREAEMPVTEKELQHRAVDLKDPLLIALKEGRIVGRCGANAYFPPYGELINLFVHPDARKEGVGAALTRECINFLRENGCLVTFLQTDNDNWAAQRMYRQLGFLPTARGEMVRMVRLDDFPPVKAYAEKRKLYDVALPSAPLISSNRPLWALQWRDPIKLESLTLWIEGDSCQAQSALAPIVGRFHVNYDAVELLAAFSGERDEAKPSDTVEVFLSLHNARHNPLNIAIETVETNGIEVDAPSSVKLNFGGSEVLPIKLSIPGDLEKNSLRFSSHESIPVTFKLSTSGFEFLISVNTRVRVG